MGSLGSSACSVVFRGFGLGLFWYGESACIHDGVLSWASRTRRSYGYRNAKAFRKGAIAGNP